MTPNRSRSLDKLLCHLSATRSSNVNQLFAYHPCEDGYGRHCLPFWSQGSPFSSFNFTLSNTNQTQNPLLRIFVQISMPILRLRQDVQPQLHPAYFHISPRPLGLTSFVVTPFLTIKWGIQIGCLLPNPTPFNTSPPSIPTTKRQSCSSSENTQWRKSGMGR